MTLRYSCTLYEYIEVCMPVNNAKTQGAFQNERDRSFIALQSKQSSRRIKNSSTSRDAELTLNISPSAPTGALHKKEPEDVILRLFLQFPAGATGLEPAISGLTGRHVNHYTTPPERFG